jgi:DNA-binding transcriptional LysR family regulator
MAGLGLRGAPAIVAQPVLPPALFSPFRAPDVVSRPPAATLRKPPRRVGTCRRHPRMICGTFEFAATASSIPRDTWMHIDQIRTFLEVAATGNFNRAAESLHVTQSTVSARIRTLEERLGVDLFVRDHSGAQLTPAGERLQRYAARLLQLWRRAESDVALPPQHRASISLGSAVSLWDQLVVEWGGWMRREAPDVALHVVADYSPALMRQLADGAMDIAVMYEPREMSGLVIEELLVEDFFLMTTAKGVSVDDEAWHRGYALVDWSDSFRHKHDDAFPDLVADITVGLGSIAMSYILCYGGSAYLPLRMAHSLVRSGQLSRVRGAPVFQRTGSVVYSSSPTDPELLQLGLRGLREATSQIADRIHDQIGAAD